MIRSRDGISLDGLENYLSLRGEVLESEWADESIKASYFGGIDHWLAFEEGGVLKAFIIYRLLGRTLEIDYLETHRKFQRQGIMTQLLARLINNYDSREFWLEVKSQNWEALNLYKMWGFQVRGSRPGYYSDGSEALLLTRPASQVSRLRR